MTSTESIIKKFIYFLVLLLPYSLVSGPFLPDLTIIFLSLYFLYKQFQLGNLKYFNNVIFKIIVIFNFWIILSSLMCLSRSLIKINILVLINQLRKDNL
jgi:hypothetical protein